MGGCSDDKPKATHSSSVTSTSPSMTATETPRTAPSGASDQLDDGSVTPYTSTPALALTQQDKDKAVREAEATMRAYVAHDGKSEAEWWKTVEPHLTLTAAQAYGTVDPRNLPSKVTKPGRLLPGAIPEVVVVGVMTDDGQFDVQLTRSTDDPVWRVNELTPPTEAGL